MKPFMSVGTWMQHLKCRVAKSAQVSRRKHFCERWRRSLLFLKEPKLAMSWQKFFLHHYLTESANIEGAQFCGILGNLNLRGSTFFFSPTITASFGIVLNQFNGFLDHRFFSPQTFGVAEWGSFCRASKSLWERRFGIILNRFDGFLDHGNFSHLTLGVAAGGSFHLWLVEEAPKIIVEGVLQLL